jgi:hypothetical protein
MMRKTAILGSGILLAVLAAGLSIAQAPVLTSGETVSEAQIHAVAAVKPVKTSKKRKRVYLAAAALPSAPSSTKTLLPAVVQTDITPHHQELADTVLRALPSGCRDHLRNFYVQYTGAKNRGLGGKTTVIIAGNVSDEEFAGLLTHECGHVIHSNWTGSAKTETAFRDGKDIFRSDSPVVDFFSISWTAADILQEGSRKADFVSGYAQSDAFEDFAETFAMYILHRDAFEERAKTNAAIAAKLNWMKTNLPTNADLLGTSRYTWDKSVPWDVTRLPYTLAAYAVAQ